MIGLTIISGGQTGVDRAALDIAIEMGLPHGGWCPKGGWAEDQPEPPGLLSAYPLLKETPEAGPAQRTEWNVRDSDALMVLVADSGGLVTSAGTQQAVDTANRLGRPHIVIDLDAPDQIERAAAWLQERSKPLRLNIAGPRESGVPGIYQKALGFLRDLFARLA